METQVTEKKVERRKPIRTYTMQQLQGIAAAPENHPAKLVEACRHEIEVREESRKYRKEVEAYDDLQIESVLADKSGHPEALVYRCHVEKRRRAKAAREASRPEAAGPAVADIRQEAAEQNATEAGPSVQAAKETEMQMSWWKRKTAEANAGVTDRSIGYLYAGLLVLFGLPVLANIFIRLFGHGVSSILDIATVIACIILVAGRRASLTPAAKLGILMTLLGPIIGFIGILVFVNSSPVSRKIRNGLTIFGVATLTVQLVTYIFLFNYSPDLQYFSIISLVSLVITVANFGYLLFLCLTEEKEKIACWWKNRRQQVQ